MSRAGHAPDADAGWIPPAPSRATRRIRGASRGSGRSRLIGHDRRVRATESFTEKRVLATLLARPDVRDVREQPAAVSYLDDQGHPRTHTFDCIVDFKDGYRLAVVVKPASKGDGRAMRRLVALIAASLDPQVADAVILMTEDDAGPDALHDARLTGSALLHPEPVHDAVLRDHLRTVTGEVTVAELRRDSGLGGHALRAIARLLYDGTLVKLTPGRILSSTAVARAPGSEASS